MAEINTESIGKVKDIISRFDLNTKVKKLNKAIEKLNSTSEKIEDDITKKKIKNSIDNFSKTITKLTKNKHFATITDDMSSSNASEEFFTLISNADSAKKKIQSLPREETKSDETQTNTKKANDTESTQKIPMVGMPMTIGVPTQIPANGMPMQMGTVQIPANGMPMQMGFVPMRVMYAQQPETKAEKIVEKEKNEESIQKEQKNNQPDIKFQSGSIPSATPLQHDKANPEITSSEAKNSSKSSTPTLAEQLRSVKLRKVSDENKNSKINSKNPNEAILERIRKSAESKKASIKTKEKTTNKPHQSGNIPSAPPLSQNKTNTETPPTDAKNNSKSSTPTLAEQLRSVKLRKVSDENKNSKIINSKNPHKTMLEQIKKGVKLKKISDEDKIKPQGQKTNNASEKLKSIRQAINGGCETNDIINKINELKITKSNWSEQFKDLFEEPIEEKNGKYYSTLAEDDWQDLTLPEDNLSKNDMNEIIVLVISKIKKVEPNITIDKINKEFDL